MPEPTTDPLRATVVERLARADFDRWRRAYDKIAQYNGWGGTAPTWEQAGDEHKRKNEAIRKAQRIADDLGDLLPPSPRRIETAEELDAVPAGTVVRSAVGTVACRHHSGQGVLFGNGEPFDWALLQLPVIVIPVPDWKVDYAASPDGGR
ncbi:hypothetical protein [Nocardia sp. N2S4-5]|uniref:hypothetical protein n=1 Tax=Nocardia sp. N2S4-5 TaxID=3351565 RepID=UPI0037D3F447